ncbi:peptidoglycan DD-metalloendopeptidase family protein [Virgibacillus sp. DJP39]|uniref:peptidoglycan DD-metalloendopeptidase family protein n=1 Tax=Virgibacillus sp. DJP39 TaxID=3409790 RepID=UPI003BB7EE5C
MKEEKNGGSKNNWSRIFRKKWFFPAVYLTIAALLLTFVVWYQNLENQIPETQDQESTEDTATDPYGEDSIAVMDQQEAVKMPVSDQDKAEIVTKFYDYNADQEDQEAALVLYNSRYYQSTGIDIASANGETFDVTASLSGTVEEVTEDPLLGNIVAISHENDILTYYTSLGEVMVKNGERVKQGDVIGTAGENLFGKEDGIHVNFEIRKNGESVNPETYFNKPVSSISVDEEKVSEDVEEESDATPDENGEQSPAPEEDTETDDSGSQDDPTNEEDGASTDGAQSSASSARA